MVIEMLRNMEFDAKDVDLDLHKWMNEAVENSRIKSFQGNMGECPDDGDQDINLWLREDLVHEIMEDPIKGNQNFNSLQVRNGPGLAR